jgi:hypothetical protein
VVLHPSSPPGTDPGWLHRRHAEWRDTGQPWDDYCRSWGAAEGLHAGQDILRELGARFDSGPITYGPYFFTDLAAISETEEQAAIDARLIQAGRASSTQADSGQTAAPRRHQPDTSFESRIRIRSSR